MRSWTKSWYSISVSGKANLDDKTSKLFAHGRYNLLGHQIHGFGQVIIRVKIWIFPTRNTQTFKVFVRYDHWERAYSRQSFRYSTKFISRLIILQTCSIGRPWVPTDTVKPDIDFERTMISFENLFRINDICHTEGHRKVKWGFCSILFGKAFASFLSFGNWLQKVSNALGKLFSSWLVLLSFMVSL